MDNSETNLQPSASTIKREIIILTFILSGVSTFFTLLFAKSVLEPIISLATAIGIGIFILWWCRVDSSERNYELKNAERCFNVTLEKGDNWIGIIAINEGTNPPASVAVKVNDGVTEQEFDIDGEVNKPGGYILKL